eukprot:Gb_04336 [translate_table: standard]
MDDGVQAMGNSTSASGMVQKRGVQFVLNGSPFYVNGFNAYWLMVYAAANDPKTPAENLRSKVSQLLREAAAAGLTVGRTWAFNDGSGWNALQTSPGIYDERVFRALDFVIAEAKKYNIHLILSLSNNWNDYGGKAQYLQWGRSIARLNLSDDDDFFSHPTLKSFFKSHIKAWHASSSIAYKDDPTIFAWELMNEPRCLSDPSGNTLQAWIQEMAAYVKSVDGEHLVEIGTEGFYGPSSPSRVAFNPNAFSQQVGTDFIRNHGAYGIDFASTHIYADTWISPIVSPAYLSFVKNWTNAHIEDCEKLLGMPVIFMEYGVSDTDRGYNTSFREKYMQTVFDSVLTSAAKGGAGGGSLLWQLFAPGMENMNDGYEIVLSQTPSTTRNLISRQSQRLAAFNSDRMC